MDEGAGCWEPNSGPLQEQYMLLTTEPALQPKNILGFIVYYTLLGVVVML